MLGQTRHSLRADFTAGLVRRRTIACKASNDGAPLLLNYLSRRLFRVQAGVAVNAGAICSSEVAQSM